MDIETIIYVILLVVFIISRVIRGAKKVQEGQTDNEQFPFPFPEEKPEPKPEMKPERVPPMREMQQKPVDDRQERRVSHAELREETRKASVKEQARMQKKADTYQAFLEAARREGEDAFKASSGKMSQMEIEEEYTYQFNPREAYMMKELLDRRYEW